MARTPKQSDVYTPDQGLRILADLIARLHVSREGVAKLGGLHPETHEQTEEKEGPNGNEAQGG